MSPSITGGSDHLRLQEDKASTIRQPSFDFSDHDASDTEHDEHLGDYSTRMEELFEDGEDDADFREKEGEEEEDDGEGFLYTGVDAADMPTGYQEQLRDVLGSEPSDDDELEAHEVARALIIDDTANIRSNDDEPLVSSFTILTCAVRVTLILMFPAGAWRPPV
jgi:vacuolar protein sorting-associated protein 8